MGTTEGIGVEIGRAQAGEVDAIASLVREHAFADDGGGALIPLSRAEIAQLVAAGAFVAAREEGGRLVGCASLVEYDGVAEVRSLVVLPGHRSRGLAARLIDACTEMAASRGYAQAFALVNADAQRVFERVGFTPEEKPPEKLARDCARCPLQGDRCKESAVVLRLSR